ncbi:MAG: histidine--tRNA ligase [Bacteroidetes bacterium]|nr:histidine--tRNA ligase [Bacteroidota bacterium]
MKANLPQGTRDFGPEIVKKRQYIFNTIRTVFELYGFQPLETPAFENMETLMGKYGDEGDKLIFKILNNGLERVEKHEQAKTDFEKILEGKNSKGITERALKYDLTIPFARYVAMNHGQINYPFKRYQIQPVWRADKPQRGRYREFTQCDADVVGSQSLFNEVELLNIYKEVFQRLEVKVEVCINNRKILAALAEMCGGIEKLTSITIAIDKLDKIGIDKVIDELRLRGNEEPSIELIKTYLQLAQQNNDNAKTLDALKSLFKNSEIGLEGISELEYLVNHVDDIKIDVTLARGLNYYTGSIVEVKPVDVQMGSIGGGGRYDDLTGLFDVPGIPGVGISFGVDRIYDVMDELNLFPETLQNSVAMMLVNFGTAFEKKNLEILQYLRSNNISCELYPDVIKFDKQLKYANKRKVGFIAMVGEDELRDGLVSVKNFTSGEQQKLKMEEIIGFMSISKNL